MAGAKEVLWRERLERQARSGLSIAAFCRREGLSPPSFYQWRRRLAESAAQRPLLMPVHVAESSEPLAGIEIELPGGAVVRLPAGTARELIAATIDAAVRAGREEAPC